MKYIKKLWFRILFSLFLGALTGELVHWATGHSDPEIFSLTLVVTGMLTFFLLSSLAWFDRYKYYFFPHWKEQTDDEGILDDLDQAESSSTDKNE